MASTRDSKGEVLTLSQLADAKIIPVGKRMIMQYLLSGELPAANFKPKNGRLNLWRIKRSDAEEFVRKKFQKDPA